MKLEKQMLGAAKNLEFEKAAGLRDRIKKLRAKDLNIIAGEFNATHFFYQRSQLNKVFNHQFKFRWKLRHFIPVTKGEVSLLGFYEYF
ncbi:MAG: hypothetical protein CM1200mP16_11880 [Nitrospina sp.]|nr:MAG: hypothetical protein CM1200mP16_11880 [Nitrospina sp.]